MTTPRQAAALKAVAEAARKIAAANTDAEATSAMYIVFGGAWIGLTILLVSTMLLVWGRGK